jgi:hypothetical protein
MPIANILKLNRNLLYNHHRLSHQQIDTFLGEKKNSLLLQEKINLMNYVQHFIAITDVLSKEGIDFISLKGPLLSYRIYKDAACRRSKDFDFLIEFNSVERVIVILKRLGFKTDWYEWPVAKDFRNFKGKLRNQFHMVHPKKKITIELHWKLFLFSPLKPAFLNSLVNNNSEKMQFAGRFFKILNPEMELLYLVIHGSLHAWRRLKWLVDVHEIISKQLFNEEAFKALVKITRAQRVVALTNEMLRFIYPGGLVLPENSGAPRYLVKHSFNKLNKQSNNEYDSLTEAMSYFIFVQKAFPGVRYKINILRFLFFSILDDGDKKKSLPAIFISFLNPASFFRKRYRIE